MKVEILQTIPVGDGDNLQVGAIMETVTPPNGRDTRFGVYVDLDGRPVPLFRQNPKEYRVVFGGSGVSLDGCYERFFHRDGKSLLAYVDRRDGSSVQLLRLATKGM